jgi:hypothetical protein
VATARSWVSSRPCRVLWPNAVKASMTKGESSQKRTVAATSTTRARVTTAEMARQASAGERVARRSTNTGMKVADSTPPSTMS